MSLDRILADPIISTEDAAFSPSRSRPPYPTERDPLLPATKSKKPFYRARPLWLVPFALTAAITRGMTLASRVEVFTELSCNQLHDNYNHTTIAYHPAIAPLDPVASSLYFPTQQYSIPESQGDGVTEGDDPRVIPGNKCVSDPAVQAGAARLQTIMTTTMGTLSALTTGWWGQFGERYGRTRVLAVSTFGLFLTDLTFILVSTPHSPLAVHSHKLLILAPIIEGSLGGWSSLMGANTAYIADCTSPGSRSTIFARFTGVSFMGIALGPVIGAWLIKHPIAFLRVGTIDHPLQSVNSVFWVAVTCSFVNLLLVLFVFPESLPAARRAANRKGKNRAISTASELTGDGKIQDTWAVTRIVRSFLSPLGAFLPTDVPVPRSAGLAAEAQGQLRRKDWSLTFLGLSLFFHMLATGIFQIKYLYAEHVYEWAAEQLSYYISLMGAVRAIHLMFLFPFLLSTFKPVRSAISAAMSMPSQTQPAPQSTTAIASTSTNADTKHTPVPTKSHLFSEIRFDLLVVRCSMFVDLWSHAAVVFAPVPTAGAESSSSAWWWSQVMFVGATSLSCSAAGVMPAVQSLALCTLQGRALAGKETVRPGNVNGEEEGAHDGEELEPGKLFGAMAVLQAVGQMILGPLVFGMIYSTTVATFPKAVFAAASILVLLSLVLTAFVRPEVSLSMGRSSRVGKGKLPTVRVHDHGSTSSSASASVAAAAKQRRKRREEEEERRGRSRVSKDLRGGAASGAGGTGVGMETEAGPSSASSAS